MPAPDPLLGYATDELRFDALLGRGGMGAVYRGRQLRLDRAVAIKVIKADLAADEAYLARFSREARTMGRLVHPHVVACHDFGTIAGPGGDPLTVMVLEFIDGASLGALQRGRTLAVREALGIYRQACDGLAAAHGLGIVHRDIKPDNIMVGADGVAKLADFGLARAEDAAQLTQTGALLGSPAYMSPEASRGDEPRPPSDVYSIGCSLFQTLTGRPPFEATSTLQVLHQHLTAEPPRLAALRPDLAMLDPLVASCLDKDPARRPDAASLARELARLGAQVADGLQAGHTLRAAPPSAVARTVAASPSAAPPRQRPSYRHLWLGAALCVFLLLLVLTAAGHRARAAGGAAIASASVPPPPAPLAATAPHVEVLAAGTGILGAVLTAGRSEAPPGAPAPPGQAPTVVMSQLGRLRLRPPPGTTSLCLVLHPGGGTAARQLRVTGGPTIGLAPDAWSVARIGLGPDSGTVELSADGGPFFCAAATAGVAVTADWVDLGVHGNALVAVDQAGLKALCDSMPASGRATLPGFARTRVLTAPALHAVLGGRLREAWEPAFTGGSGDRDLIDQAVEFGPATRQAARAGVRWCFLVLDAREGPGGRARPEVFADSVEAMAREGMLVVPVVGAGLGAVANRAAWREWEDALHRRLPGLPILDLHAVVEAAERNRTPGEALRWNDALATGLRELRARIEAALPRQPQP